MAARRLFSRLAAKWPSFFCRPQRRAALRFATLMKFSIRLGAAGVCCHHVRFLFSLLPYCDFVMLCSLSLQPSLAVRSVLVFVVTCDLPVRMFLLCLPLICLCTHALGR